jgi:hypothetical protein
MQLRPTSLTVACWILIVLGLLGILPLFMGTMHDPHVVELMNKNPIPLAVQYALISLGALVTSGSGVLMLYRQSWARLVYVSWSILGIIIGLTTSPFKIMLLPGIAVFAVIAFFLFRPAANAYFAGVSGE